MRFEPVIFFFFEDLIGFIYFIFNLRVIALQSEKAMAPHSRTLAWKIPWTEEPAGLRSMGSLGVGRD